MADHLDKNTGHLSTGTGHNAQTDDPLHREVHRMPRNSKIKEGTTDDGLKARLKEHAKTKSVFFMHEMLHLMEDHQLSFDEANADATDREEKFNFFEEEGVNDKIDRMRF